MSVVASSTAPPGSLSPLGVDRAREQNDAWFVRASWLLMGLGVLVRLVRYLVDYPIWHDEAFLAASLWDRSFGELAQPLEYGQVAPWMFLAVERAFVLAFGYSEMTLRLFPTICSVASVVVFRWLASRLFRGWALVLSVAVFASAFYPIRHGNEIKPYSADLLAALLLLTFAVEYLRKPESSRWWWIGAAALPVLLGVSYPAVFVAGGIWAATAPAILLKGTPKVRAGLIAYGAVMLASFLAIYMAATVVQQKRMGSFYRLGYWSESFPPTDRPLWIPVWLLEQHAGNMLAYPVGERQGGSAATLVCVIAGVMALWRRDRRTLAAVLVAPFGLGLIAAFLGKYPYGGEARIMQYVAPSVCLLTGLGMAALAARIRRPGWSRRVPPILLGAMAALAVGLIVKDLVQPYRVAKDVTTRDFARRFWTEQARDADLACVKTDFGVEIEPHTWEAGMSAVYLFHQRMYSPRHRRGEPLRLEPENYSEKRPLRVVLFRDYGAELPGVQSWMAAMSRDFEPWRSTEFVVDPGPSRESWLRDAYGVFDFVSRPRPSALGSKKASDSAHRF